MENHSEQKPKMSLEEAREMFPGFKQTTSAGADVMLFKITPKVAEDSGREEGSFVFLFDRPAQPDDDEAWQKYQQEMHVARDRGRWKTELSVGPEAAEAMLCLLCEFLLPDLVEWAKEQHAERKTEPAG